MIRNFKRRHFLGAMAGASCMAKSGFAASGLGLPAGYIVPAEELPHRRTFMQWPNNRKVYSDRIFLRMTQKTIADIANKIAQF